MTHWMLVVTAAALTGWFWAMRPNAPARGVANSVGFLILILASLMCIIALTGQGGPRAAQGALTPFG
ncbi:MAG: hypothetical protein KDA32_08560 [Phycisphaerales bacterium]|nr:hypothetical protein [Phycisphaerales bacterium]